MSSKKILALIGTKRKHNTYDILKLFESLLLKHDFKMEYAFLHEISLCNGCLKCVYEGIEAWLFT